MAKTETYVAEPEHPEYVLFSTTEYESDDGEAAGRWHIMLGRPEGEVVLDVEEVERDVRGERLDLLSVIRGLEAIEQPASVTLFTSSRYVQRGLRYGLENWRRSAWRWERFGRMVPVKNDDLWRRLDQALQYHQLECRYWRFDAAARDSNPLDERDATAA